VTPRTLTTLLLVLLAGLGAGCGADSEGKPLPRRTASELLAQLQSIQDRFDFPGGQACDDITDSTDPNTTKVANLIDSLPDDVDPDLRNALQQSFDHLFDLVRQECGQDSTQTETDTTPTETTPTETTPTETTPTETTPTETTPTETTPTETTPTETTPATPPDSGGTGGGTGVPGVGE
jgi:cell division septation protein DedD